MVFVECGLLFALIVTITGINAIPQFMDLRHLPCVHSLGLLALVVDIIAVLLLDIFVFLVLVDGQQLLWGGAMERVGIWEDLEWFA